jgi:hypothetical protein
MCGGLCGYEMNEISEPLRLAEVMAEKKSIESYKL